ncbi:MAG: hypothetical protein MUC68_09655 [Burkholderiaceae bacterium]|nr:hypothetical protein [Burkholderiaceae bacterium]
MAATPQADRIATSTAQRRCGSARAIHSAAPAASSSQAAGHGPRDSASAPIDTPATSAPRIGASMASTRPNSALQTKAMAAVSAVVSCIRTTMPTVPSSSSTAMSASMRP